ncbi:MAG: hypothetical protein Q4C65_04920 [Eubacteriales bacterium]|nr:hypothetical protein [Eubacteriales bacterium]
MLGQIREAVSGAQMVLVGIGAELAPDRDKAGVWTGERLLEAYKCLAKLLEGKNYFVLTLCSDGLIFESGLQADRIVAPSGEGYSEEDWQRYTGWLQHTLNRKLLVLELGAGMEAPEVIRFAFEKVVYFNQKAYLYRVHSRLYQLTEELKGRGCSVALHPAALLLEGTKESEEAEESGQDDGNH